MKIKVFVKFVAAAALTLTILPHALPAHAATASVGQFYANCNVFSVDVAVNGINPEVNGLDRFRYLITDGTGKKLYLEDGSRGVNQTVGSSVMNLSYDADGVADGGPTKNPITFAVYD